MTRLYSKFNQHKLRVRLKFWSSLLIVTCVNFIVIHESHATSALMCVDHYPPLQVIDGDHVTGENVEIIKQLAKKMKLQLSFTPDTPFKRCLDYLKQGKVDLMSGLLDSPERREFAHLMLYDDLTIKSTFVHKDGTKVNSFSDLTNLNIGILRGVKQFKQFDEAPKGMFNITEVNTLPAAFGMLAKKRLDAVITTDNYGLQILKTDEFIADNVVKSGYEVKTGTQVYIALSKKSPLANRIEEFESTVNTMFTTDEFVKIIMEFQTNNPEFYP